MVTSFKKRIESLFMIKGLVLKQQMVNILAYDLQDNVNSYLMREDGTYIKITPGNEAIFDIHQAFFELTLDEMMQGRFFE